MAEKERYLYRITHIDNIPHILKNGITHRNSPNANPNFVSIGDSRLIEKRNEFLLDNGTLLGEYIPFYFATRTPMLYVIQNGFNGVKQTRPEEIVYCVTSVEEIKTTGLDFIFTDGHAKDSFSTQYSKVDVNNINSLIDFNAIEARYWNNDIDTDLKRKKEAEFLVLGDIPLNSLKGFAVYNELAEKELQKLEIPAHLIIAIRGHYYF